MSIKRPMGVGSQTLLKGTKMAGYYGDVTGLITANELRSLVGVTEGITMQTGDIKLMKFSHNNKTLYIPEKPLNHSIPWDTLQLKDLVFGKMVEIKGSMYLVRLMQGSSINPTVVTYSGATPPTSVTGQNSEWDSLFVPLVKTWSSKTEAELGINSSEGSYTWCQEVHSHALPQRVVRGRASVSNFGNSYSTNTSTDYGWRPVFELLGNLNESPTIEVTTTDGQTLYDGDNFNVVGTTKDNNPNDIVTVRYSISNGTDNVISTAISTGVSIPFNKTLKFKDGKLYDGVTALTDTLLKDTPYFIKIWSTDDIGGKSNEEIRNFQVVPNRPALITVKPLNPHLNLIDSDFVTIEGNVTDPDGNNVTVKYKIGISSAYEQVYSGASGDFSFQVELSKLKSGVNRVYIRAEDTYNAISDKIIDITKDGVSSPVNKSTTRYKLTPPNNTAKGVLLWVEREIGDLIIDAEISMEEEGAVDNFKKMTKSSTAYVSEGVEEDEFTFDNVTPKSNIILKLTMARTSSSSNFGIRLITGVLN